MTITNKKPETQARLMKIGDSLAQWVKWDDERGFLPGKGTGQEHLPMARAKK